MPAKPASEDDCLNCIGRVSHNAATIDMILCNVFRIISELDAEPAIALYYTPDASTVKFGLITNLMKLRCDEEEQNIIEDMFSHTRKTNKIRNDLGHSFLHQSHTHGLQRIRPRDKKPRKTITKRGLQSTTDKTMKYVLETAHMFTQLCEKRGVRNQLLF